MVYPSLLAVTLFPSVFRAARVEQRKSEKAERLQTRQENIKQHLEQKRQKKLVCVASDCDSYCFAEIIINISNRM